MWGTRPRRFPRPVYLTVLALVLIFGGCYAIETAATIALGGPRTGYDNYASQRQPAGGGQAPAPAVGPLPQPPPTSPTWTGTIRVTTQGMDMRDQPPKVDTFGGVATVAYSPSNGTLSTENSEPAAIWTAERDPTLDECMALVSAQPLSPEERTSGTAYRQGQGLCVVTYGKTAMAFVRGISTPGGEAVQMTAKRWPLTSN